MGPLLMARLPAMEPIPNPNLHPSARRRPQNSAASVSPTLACMAWLVEGMIAFHYGGIRPRSLSPALLCFVPSSIKSSSEATTERKRGRGREAGRTDGAEGASLHFMGWLQFLLASSLPPSSVAASERAMVVLDWMLVDIESGEGLSDTSSLRPLPFHLSE